MCRLLHHEAAAEAASEGEAVAEAIFTNRVSPRAIYLTARAMDNNKDNLHSRDLASHRLRIFLVLYSHQLCDKSIFLNRLDLLFSLHVAKDKTSGVLLLLATTNGYLYPLNPSPPTSLLCPLAVTTSGPVWHRRLGYCGKIYYVFYTLKSIYVRVHAD
ncbi:unnamed protein product [Cuscuta europaea]|uniref:Uncharacterized protein n=1 Tax=Cuscuta europaea TaxID=41803 RepID=A0A9P0ZU07_CUSEU|nr:unnamed protein product [Cuscuta europaea]